MLSTNNPYTDFLPDTGCELHPSCLQCPRAVCKYDEVSKFTPKNIPLSYVLAVWNLMRPYDPRNIGLGQAVADEVGIDRATVYRMMKRGGENVSARN